MEERAAAAAGIKMVCSHVAFGVRWSEPVRQARLRALFVVVQKIFIQKPRFCIISVSRIGRPRISSVMLHRERTCYGTRHER
jgi:hypothetical protein